jgi:hypothetical protein
MFKRVLFAIPLFCLILVSGCKLLEVPKDAEEFGQKYLDMLVEKEYVKSYDIFSEEVKKQFTIEKHKGAIDIIDTEFGKYNSIKTVGWHIFHAPERTTYNLSYELQYPGKWALFSIRFAKVNNEFIMEGYNISPLKDSLENMNKFSFKGKGIIHYLFLLFMIAEVLFIIYVLTLCIKTRMKKKVLWFLFILCGVVSISLNWSEGVVNIQPLSIQFILGVSFFKQGPYAPWILTFTIPLGAILFLIKRKRSIQVEGTA